MLVAPLSTAELQIRVHQEILDQEQAKDGAVFAVPLSLLAMS